jgi:hypothetical protein
LYRYATILYLSGIVLYMYEMVLYRYATISHMYEMILYRYKTAPYKYEMALYKYGIVCKFGALVFTGTRQTAFVGGGKDATVSIAVRQRRTGGVCLWQTPIPKSGRMPDFGTTSLSSCSRCRKKEPYWC